MTPFGRALGTVLAAVALSAAGFGGCDGGTSSETVGAVVATAGQADISGRTDPGNSLGLYSADFLPHAGEGFARSLSADSTGGFVFPALEPGIYQLLVRRPSDGKAALLRELEIPGAFAPTRRADLESTGSLTGTITDSASASNARVYVPGTPFFAEGDEMRRYSLSGLPRGTYPVVKSWIRPLPCESPGVCGGIENRKDTALVRIVPGEKATW
jgi:hypothetical protein